MPLYEYHCKACDENVEMLVGAKTKTRELACPDCSEKQLEKLFSTFAARSSANGGSTSVGEPCGTPGCPRESGFT